MIVLTLFGCLGLGQGVPEPDETRTVEVIAEDYEFRPVTINAEAGEAIRVVLRNEGSQFHNIEFALPDGDVAIRDDVPPGENGELLFYAPAREDDYDYYCPVGDHRDRGMTGTLVVGEGGGGGIFD